MDPQSQQIPPPMTPGQVQDVPQSSPNGNSSTPMTPGAVQLQSRAPGNAAGSPPLALQADQNNHATPASPAPVASAHDSGGGISDVDKEWVGKARNIVWQTRSDPYTQSKEISILRAEYLRVRFDKHANIVEDAQP